MTAPRKAAQRSKRIKVKHERKGYAIRRAERAHQARDLEAEHQRDQDVHEHVQQQLTQHQDQEDE